MDRIPQVLLVGNGLNRAFEYGKKWSELLKTIEADCKGTLLPECVPATLNVFAAANGSPVPAFKKDEIVSPLYPSKADNSSTVEIDDKYGNFLRGILSMKFDDILTTNYGYEFEAAANNNSIAKSKLPALQTHTRRVKRCESRYMLYTYNIVPSKRLWHIHGELRKPNSIVIDHNYYGNLVFKIKDYLREHGGRYSKPGELEITSWVDAFIAGNLYIIGLEFDFVEFDLWWLLNRKRNEKAIVGRTYYYYRERKKEQKTAEAVHAEAKLQMLVIMGVEVIRISEESYVEFYNKALADIRQKISESGA